MISEEAPASCRPLPELDLPPGWIDEVRQAALEDDLDRIGDLSEQIQECAPELADNLARLVYHYDVHGLMNLLQEEKP